MAARKKEGCEQLRESLQRERDTTKKIQRRKRGRGGGWEGVLYSPEAVAAAVVSSGLTPADSNHSSVQLNPFAAASISCSLGA